MKNLLFILLFVISYSTAYTQSNSFLREKTLLITNDTIIFDSLSTIPNSFQIYSNNKPFSNYKVVYNKSTLILKTPLPKSIHIKYRVFDFKMPDSIYHKLSPKNYTKLPGKKKELYAVTTNESNNFFTTSKLSKSGSMARGITVGNNRDASLSSDFNLQLSGKLSPEIDILATVSDNNIPVQADGSSQNLREFDKVFIQISSKNSKLIAGDYNIHPPKGYFAKLNKKVKGLSIETTVNKNDTVIFSTNINTAITKGKYNKMLINGEEGNQGPYRLKGANNETYIIILSGTEKVYLEGKLLTRGTDFDYTINYNTAEISFTVQNQITKDSRITIEFEYSDMNFTRYIATSTNEYKFKNSSLFLNLISESDSKNQSLLQELSANDKSFLNGLGDNINNAFVDNVAFTDTFNSDIILYKRIDTTVNITIYENIFVYSTNPENAKYTLGFTNVGTGNGNYIREINSTNGRIYKWLAPINGVLQGEYEPVKLIISPKKKQMITIGGEYNNKKTIVSGEVAYTNNDLNTFSNLNDNDNSGYAARLDFSQKLQTNDTSILNVELLANITFNNNKFNAFEPYRDVEFNRDWNITETTEFNQELFTTLGFKLILKNTLKINYTFDSYNSQISKANRNNFSIKKSSEKYKYFANASRMISTDTAYNTDFLRYKIGITRNIKKIDFGITDQGERNIFIFNDENILSNNSFRYNSLESFLNFKYNKTNYFSFLYNLREDFASDSVQLNYASKSDNYTVKLNLNKNSKSIFNVSFTYRNLKYSSFKIIDAENEKSSVGKVNYTARLFNNFANTSTTIEYGTGREAKKEFTYIEVQPGMGYFTWQDFNENGLKELNEFVKAEFQDEATYIRIALLSEDYEDVFSTNFIQTLNLKFKNIFNDSTKFNRLISAISNTSTISLNKKNSNSFTGINVFWESTNLITDNSNIRNTLRYSSFNRKYLIEYNYRFSQNRILLVNGIDTKLLAYNSIIIQRNFKNFKVNAEYKIGEKHFNSEFFENNNYKITYNEQKLKTIIKVDKNIQSKVFTRYSNKINITNNDEITILEAGFNINYSISNKGRLSSEFKFINANFTGETNTFSSYEMLEALNNGKNYIFTIGWDKAISRNLQLGVNYSGRKSSDNKIIHNGGFSLRAIF